MTKEKIYSIIDFTEYPGLRYKSQGDYSGELLYESYLKDLFQQTIENDTILIVNLDGTAGYAASFIDELFGNIVYDFGMELFNKHLQIVSNEEPEWITMIEEVKKDWQYKKDNDIPRKPKIE